MSTRKKRQPSEVEARTIQGLKEAIAFERGELPNVRVRRVTARQATVEPPPDYTGADVRRVRARLNVSQPVFGWLMGVGPEAVKSWEQDKRTPDGSARRLLQVAERHPDIVLSTVRATPVATATTSRANGHGALAGRRAKLRSTRRSRS